MLADAVRRDKSEVFALWTENSAADPVVDEAKSQVYFRQEFPNIKNILVGGTHQGHANSPQNSGGYKRALEQVNALSQGNW